MHADISWHTDEIMSVCKHLCRVMMCEVLGAFCTHFRRHMQVELQAVALVVLSYFRDAAAAARLADTVQALLHAILSWWRVAREHA